MVANFSFLVVSSLVTISETKRFKFSKGIFLFFTKVFILSYKKIYIFVKNTHFEKLEILDFIDSEIESFVTFKATLFQNKKDISFIEKSRFLKESNIWLYVDGEFLNS